MEILHTPWRRKYVVSARDYEGCLFCDLLAPVGDDEARYILQRSATACLMLNTYPYTPGHLMAVPMRHASSTREMPREEWMELLELCRRGEWLLRRAYGCRSVHIGANLGAAAGAGVPEHLHFHVVAWPEEPLWSQCRTAADAPESLADSYRRLRELLDEAVDPPGGVH